MIENNLTYQPPIEEIKTENDVILLMDSVKDDISHLNTLTKFFPLSGVLNIINKGVYRIKRKDGVYDAIDLSKAQSLISDYKSASEGGCKSCKYIKRSKPYSDETLSYCGFSEKEKEISEFFMQNDSETYSPKIKKHLEKGCEDRESKFRPLDVVLLEAEKI